MNVIGIPGSVRKGSLNVALLRAAADLAPDDCNVEIASIRGIPLYDGEFEASEGVPESVAALKERIAAADGLLLVSPEYNNSLPGPLKNAIDWLSRPSGDVRRVFGGRPVGLMGATPGQGGTRLSQAAWLPVLRALGVQVWPGGPLYVANAREVFGEGGALVDGRVRERLTRYMLGFARFVDEHC